MSMLDGKMAQCAGALTMDKNSAEDDFKVVTARATTKKANCAFPFWYKGQLASDCVKQGKANCSQTKLFICRPQMWIFGTYQTIQWIFR